MALPSFRNLEVVHQDSFKEENDDNSSEQSSDDQSSKRTYMQRADGALNIDAVNINVLDESEI